MSFRPHEVTIDHQGYVLRTVFRRYDGPVVASSVLIEPFIFPDLFPKLDVFWLRITGRGVENVEDWKILFPEDFDSSSLLTLDEALHAIHPLDVKLLYHDLLLCKSGSREETIKRILTILRKSGFDEEQCRIICVDQERPI